MRNLVERPGDVDGQYMYHAAARRSGWPVVVQLR